MSPLANILLNIVARDALPPAVCAAIAAGIEETNESLGDALAEHYWRKPYLLARDLVGIPVWPCGHGLEDLLFLCRVRLAQQKNRAGYTAVSLRAADRCLVRMIATRDTLEDELARRAVEGEAA